MFKSGFITIIGRPNVGKSTLINAILGQKIAITSNKVQTTRHNIIGIKTASDYQMIFLDTPGIFYSKGVFNKKITENALATIADNDLIIFLVDKKKTLEEEYLIKLLKKNQAKVFLVINKIDKFKKSLDQVIVSYLNTYDFLEYVPISAAKGENIAKLLELIYQYLPLGPKYYSDSLITTESNETVVRELIREKVLWYTKEEVPHSVLIELDDFQMDLEKKAVNIIASIIVLRDSQKGILIGQGGSMLKKISIQAKKDINKVLNLTTHLELWVKVKKDWQDKVINII